ncbi:MAG: DUF1415 domain-containing protein [Pseudomonadota bacterium]
MADSFDTLSLLTEVSTESALSPREIVREFPPSNSHVISATRLWVERVVIGFNLCPFARREFDAGRVRFTVSVAETEEALLTDLHQEIEQLLGDPAVETTLLVHPRTLDDFMAYNQFLSVADALLRELGLEGVLQIASFHPDYRFADAEPDAGENFTNRSPFPMLHLLREESVSHAVASHPDVDGIPVRNVTLLSAMGARQLRDLCEACHRDA